jgi:hypothetical protein
MTGDQTLMAPVLHRRILGEGPRAAGCHGDPAGDTRRLRDAGVIVADNVAAYFYGPDSPEHWQLARNLPTLLPRGARVGEGWFIEWRLPARSSLTAYGATMILTGPVPRHGCWLDVRSGPEALREDAALAATLETLGYARRTRWLLTIRCFEERGDGPVVALPETGHLPLDGEGRAFWHDNADLLLLDRGQAGGTAWPPIETILDLNDLLPLAALTCALSRCANISLIEHGEDMDDRWYALGITNSMGGPIPAGQFGWPTAKGEGQPIWRIRPG